MPITKLKPLNWAGDTIVEVLIVVVVIGAVLSSGYAIATSSLQAIQLTQEKNYALKIAEGQLESLKAVAATIPAAQLNNQANGFCLDSSATPPQVTGMTGSPTPALATEQYANYPNNCKKDPSGGAACNGLCYRYGIISVGNNNYTASVRWDGPTGQRQQVQLSYRLYP